MKFCIYLLLIFFIQFLSSCAEDDEDLYEDPQEQVKQDLHEAEMEKKHITGLLHHNTDLPTADEDQELVDTPLCDLTDEMMRPSKEIHAKMMAKFRM